MASVISAAEITQFRELYRDLALPDLCKVIRLDRTIDSGGETIVERVLYDALECRYSEQLSTRDMTRIGRDDITVDAKVSVPALSDINERDRIQVYKRNPEDAENRIGRGLGYSAYDYYSFEVVQVIGKNEWEIFKTVYIRRVA